MGFGFPFDDIGNAVASAGEAAGNMAADASKAVAEGAGAAAGAIGDVAGAAADAAGDTAGAAAEAVGNAVTSAGEAFGNMAADAGKAVAEGAGAAAGAVGDAAGAVAGAAGGAANVAGGAVAEAGKAIAVGAGAVGDAVGHGAGEVGRVAAGAIGSAGAAVGEAAGGLSQGAIALFSGAKETLTGQQAMAILSSCYESALIGIPGVKESAQCIANEYLKQHDSFDAAALELIRVQVIESKAPGFVLPLGGPIKLPKAFPAGKGELLFLLIRMIAAIAMMGGHDITNDKVKTKVMHCLIDEVSRSFGIDARSTYAVGCHAYETFVNGQLPE